MALGKDGLYSLNFREGSHSRKLRVASPPPPCHFIAVRVVSPPDSAAFWRDIATPAARITYEELQVVAAELPENLVLCIRNIPDVALPIFP
jgi:hypothetical protein